jgi:23S rRNA (cytosine1962-C5)-methyltransferase
VLHNYADPPTGADATIAAAARFLTERLPWVQTVVVKARNAPILAERHGVVRFGAKPETRVREHGVWYALDLLAQRDAGLYLDTRNLRAWAMHHLAGKSVLNTFAYTGSLGVAAMAGGARRVVQTDLKREYLNIAKTSYTLNGFPIVRADFQAGDFWTHISRMKRAGERFDCVFVDPPFFAATGKGTVDLVAQSHRVINKVRPLINDGGALVAINNALFVSGADYMRTLETLCADGYLAIEELIPVPPDCTGYPETRVRPPLVDPAPFNHSTKIAVLRVRRKLA